MTTGMNHSQRPLVLAWAHRPNRIAQIDVYVGQVRSDCERPLIVRNGLFDAAEAVLTGRSHRELGLSDEQAMRLYRLMLLTRALDERIWALNRQGRVGITAP